MNTQTKIKLVALAATVIAVIKAYKLYALAPSLLLTSPLILLCIFFVVFAFSMAKQKVNYAWLSCWAAVLTAAMV